ncbi:hypothetical protein IX84_31230 [Phaeodactylibacter xiamenensis]|uniref:Uncharacterized protein n=1 Tax=Phaeodactylibacter xiamenensis TaxID=1524460 RepID=A0A098RY84_9BACT|nr:hypothetical protein IX84_31230 [Phaeodactylibacter xiamenensis]
MIDIRKILSLRSSPVVLEKMGYLHKAKDKNRKPEMGYTFHFLLGRFGFLNFRCQKSGYIDYCYNKSLGFLIKTE